MRSDALIARTHFQTTHDDLTTMAHVIAHQPHQVPFHTRPVNHAPSPLGFGFGLSSTPATSAWPAPHVRPLTAPLIAQAHIAQNRIAKRRLEHDDDEACQRDARDDAMERSPTPERPKRAAPKRARTTPGVIATGRGQKENQAQGNTPNDGSDVDVGVLLGTCSQGSRRFSTPLTTLHQRVYRAKRCYQFLHPLFLHNLPSRPPCCR